MAKLGQWVLDNKEWLFSGIGGMLLIWIGRMLFNRRKAASSQRIRSGRNSTNLQAGRDIHLKNEAKHRNGEEH